ncbi:potassium transporter 5-like [Nymphaea colorata]|nr:potassium transporter 5-like [Nymphaea colorata]
MPGDQEVVEEGEMEQMGGGSREGLKEKKMSWGAMLKRLDSLDVESAKMPHGHGHGHHNFGWGTTLRLAFQSIGIVYGDIGTSPLYVYASTFTHGIKNEDDILGVLSLIYYTIILITMVKYIFIVLRANDNGNGGTFALYSLVCRHAKVSFIPNEQAEDRVLSNYQLELPSKRLKRASWLKKKLESTAARYALLMMTILGTSMVVGDGILTPCISVLSAVGGLQRAASSLTQDKIVMISVIILICLFQAQRFGTDRVGYTFAPIIFIWFAFIELIGIYNFIKYDPMVIKAFNPAYIIHYFTRNKKEAWVSLGGVVLCITGTEAMFADLGHFTVRSIQISMCSIVFPALICTYTGQASYLRKNSHNVGDTFYASIPGPLYWPMFAVAVAASIIASQAMISGVFSILQQAVSLGCFPRVKIVHTSAKYEGQVYIPEVNFLLMCACIGVTAGFQTTAKIGNAYGIAVMTAEAITSAFLILIMIMIWKKNIFLVIVYILTIVPVEYIYLSSVFYKFLEGGYLPLAFASVVMFIMSVWNYVHRTKYIYEMQNKISTERVREVASKPHMHRMPGLGLFYSELVQGIPPIFSHYASNITALHSVLVFVAIKPLPVSKIIPEERFLFRRVGPHELRVYRCIVRYGYTDLRSEKERFEELLIERLKEFIREEASFMPRHDDSENLAENEDASMDSSDSSNPADNRGSTKHVVLSHTGNVDPAEELSMVDRASNAGIVYLLGETELVAKQGSGLGKRIIVNYVYNFIKRNLRQGDQALAIPRRHLLKVGMTYEL